MLFFIYSPLSKCQVSKLWQVIMYSRDLLISFLSSTFYFNSKSCQNTSAFLNVSRIKCLKKQVKNKTKISRKIWGLQPLILPCTCDWGSFPVALDLERTGLMAVFVSHPLLKHIWLFPWLISPGLFVRQHSQHTPKGSWPHTIHLVLMETEMLHHLRGFILN